jgi:hypothetical protein
MFFSKKLKITSDLIDDSILKESFLSYPKNIPSYFPKIPKRIGFSLRKRSIRSCSGFLNYFRNMICFLSPCDIEIIYDEKQYEVSFGKGKLNDGNRFRIQGNDQFLNFINQDKYYTIAQMLFNIKFSCPYPIIINNPWWNLSNFEILPGVINATKVFQEMNLFIPLPKNLNRIFIKKGTPLCYMLFETNKDIKIEFVKYHSTFQYEDYYFSTLKKYLNKKRIFLK